MVKDERTHRPVVLDYLLASGWYTSVELRFVSKTVFRRLTTWIPKKIPRTAKDFQGFNKRRSTFAMHFVAAMRFPLQCHRRPDVEKSGDRDK